MRFFGIVGQDRVKNILLRTVSAQRIPHAFLFAGPEGVGKRTTALAFFSFLVCEDPTENDSCGLCRACNMVDAGTFPDLAILQPEKGVIKIDAIRQATPRLQFEPLIGPWKGLIIDNADLMTLEAANAALKTLEEPPSKTLFILISSNPDVLPRTVISRCITLNFNRLSTEDVAAIVAEERGLSPAEIVDAAALSMGSPGRAIRLLDSPLMGERRAFIQTFLELGTKGLDQLLAFSKDVASSKGDEADVLLLLESLLQDIVHAASGSPDSDFCNYDMVEEIRGFANKIGIDKALAAVNAWTDWDYKRRYHPDLRAALDKVFLALGGNF